MGSGQPLFSVIMPTYNRADVALEAVRSVLAQSYRDFEFIIVDDRSTDDTRAVLARLTDPRVTVVTNDRSTGTAGARNMGIFLAHGDWICQIDSDDLWPEDMLERLAAAIAEADEDVGIFYGSIVFFDILADRVRDIRRADRSGDVHDLLLEDHFMHHCSGALRADAVRAVGGYDEELAQQEDSDILIRLTQQWTVVALPDIKYVKREGRADRLMIDPRALRSFEQLYDKHARELARLPRARYVQLEKIFDLAIIYGNFGSIARTWPKLLPSIWEEPKVGRRFLRQQAKVGALLINRMKGRVRRLLRR